MAGPWDKYQAPTEPDAGPWSRYADAQAPVAAPGAAQPTTVPPEHHLDAIAGSQTAAADHIDPAVVEALKGLGLNDAQAQHWGGIDEPTYRDVYAHTATTAEAKALGDKIEAILKPRWTAKGREDMAVTDMGREGANADRGAALLDGVTFGFGDELLGGLAAGKTAMANLGSRMHGEEVPYSAGDAYRGVRDSVDAQRRNFETEHPIQATGLEIGGSLANPVSIMGGEFVGGARGLGVGAKATRAAAVSGVGGGIYGAGSAAPGERLGGAVGGAGTGFVTGGVLQAGGSTLAASAARKAAAPPAPQRILANLGVKITPGQMVGGITKRTEDLAMRLPILGPSIRSARERGVEGLGRAVAGEALAPIGEKLPASVASGHDTVDYVARRLGAEYDRAAHLIPALVTDDTLLQELGVIRSSATELSPDLRSQFLQIIQNRVVPRLSRPVDGASLRQIQSELGTLARNYSSSSDGGERALADHLEQVSSAIGSQIARASPEAGAIIDSANKGYANFVRLRNAASKTPNGVITPGGLKTAVRSMDNSVGKGNVARGTAVLGDVSKAASAVLPDSYGNPGTSDVGGYIALAGLSGHSPAAGVATAAGLGAGALVYSKPVLALVNQVYRARTPGEAEAALADLTQLAARQPEVAHLVDELRAQLGGPTTSRSLSPLSLDQTQPRQLRIPVGAPVRR